jgi:tetratricopeptide (TPR) repeat protein
MKLISKVAYAAAGLVFIGSSVFAQSLADAKKAIDAEQYQKAKSILKNLTTTQPTKDENFFYLGWVYTIQDYTDSAKVVFNQGITANPKSALNYAGLGVVAHLDRDNSNATMNFDKAIANAAKDSKPYVYIGKGYLLLPPGKGTTVAAADANAAIAVLTKGLAVNAKDVDLNVALGDAYRSQLKSNDAYKYYSDAVALNPQSAVANVAIGVLWKYANNFEDAEKQFQKAISIDPNFGPAYREWAETDLRWALNEPKMASEKVKQAADEYRKYLSLTDMSIESRMRYADFLIQAGDYKTLQTEAAALSASANTNLRVYRYLGYSAYENGDYPAGLTAMNKWISQAGEKRIIPRDYLYLGRLQMKSNQDSLGIQSLRKAYQMDSTQTDVFSEIAKNYYAAKKYKQAGDAYRELTMRDKKAGLLDYFHEGISYYFAYSDQLYSTAANKAKPDTMLITYADSAFSHVQHKAAAPSSDIAIYQARLNDLKETDRNNAANFKGYAKPYYEQYISLITAKGAVADKDKKPMAEAYAYLGNYYEYKEKDAAKADENFAKARDLDPTNKSVQQHFAKGGAPAKGK